MPETPVFFFSDEEGSAPAFEALRAMLRQGKRKELAKCLVRISRLAERGHELRRPESDLLRDGWELKEMSKQTSNALEIVDRIIGDDSGLRVLIEEERVNAEVAREIHDLRTERGLTQRQLAERIGTTQSVIARLEDADYEGHSLRMLRRVAGALDARVTVRMVPTGSPV